MAGWNDFKTGLDPIKFAREHLGFEADARQHWLACHAARAAKLMIERQQRQKIGACRLGCEQRPEEAVAVGATHQVEHILMRCSRREVRRGHRGKRLACDR